MNGRADNGNEIRMGVEIDRWGRPTAYYFENGMRHPGDFQFPSNTVAGPRFNRIRAEEIIHLYLVERPGQTRGVPWLASTIERMHHLHGYEQAEVVAARASSSLMGFITSPEGQLYGDEVQDGERLTDFAPGQFKYLQPGESITVPSLNRPGGEFDPFMRAMLRAVAAGVGCSYESISKDFSQTNYSSSRLSLLEERDNWKVLQSWLIDNLHQRVFERWLDLAVLSGTLDLPRYETDPEFYRRPRWMPRGWQWVDPAKEVAAAVEAVQAGFKTQAEIIAESGGDIEEVFQQRRRELDLAQSLDLDFTTKVETPAPDDGSNTGAMGIN
jgi:lambda family phage portal protein